MIKISNLLDPEWVAQIETILNKREEDARSLYDNPPEEVDEYNPDLDD